MNIYDIFGSGRKPAVTESKIEVVHEYVNEDFSGPMFGANNEDIAGPGGSDNNDSTSPIHGFGEDYDNIPNLENVGEQVVSIMDAERRLAQGDRIFAFHEMDEEPSEIHDVGQLAGYDAEQLLAVPQGVTEGGPFSYGKPPRKGSVAANAEQKRKEQDRKTPPIEPKDQRVGNAKITKGVAEGSLNEFAPGDSGDDRTYEYEVYQCNPNDKFDWIGEPLYKTDRMDKAHGIAYELWKKHPDKAFMIWQERSQGSRGGYGIKDDEQGVAEGSDSYTVANDPDKPGMHSYREVGHAVQSGHSDAAKIYKNNKFLGTVGDVRKQGVAEAPHDEVDYDDKYQAMVKRVGQKAREQQRHEPVDLVKLAQRLRQADKTTDTTDEDVMESRLSAMKRAGYDIL
jgi:hypothetical protein